MPILPPKIPADGTEVISRALAPMARQPGTIASRVAADTSGDGSVRLEFAAPHPVFVVDLEHVAAGRLLDAVQADGWRYLLLRNDRVVGSATVEWDESRSGFVFSHVTQGPYVASTGEGIARVEQLPEVQYDDFELRLLDIPELALRALWLHGGRSDLLVPLRPAPSPIKAYQPYSEQQLVDEVRELASTLLTEASERMV